SPSRPRPPWLGEASVVSVPGRPRAGDLALHRGSDLTIEFAQGGQDPLEQLEGLSPPATVKVHDNPLHPSPHRPGEPWNGPLFPTSNIQNRPISGKAETGKSETALGLSSRIERCRGSLRTDGARGHPYRTETTAEKRKCQRRSPSGRPGGRNSL